jgi:hypothetical protein
MFLKAMSEKPGFIEAFENLGIMVRKIFNPSTTFALLNDQSFMDSLRSLLGSTSCTMALDLGGGTLSAAVAHVCALVVILSPRCSARLAILAMLSLWSPF